LWLHKMPLQDAVLANNLPRAFDGPDVHDPSFFVNEHPAVKIARRAGVAGQQFNGLADLPGRGVADDAVLFRHEKES
jgi:hypothetical protein